MAYEDQKNKNQNDTVYYHLCKILNTQNYILLDMYLHK